MNTFQQLDEYGQSKVIPELNNIFSGFSMTYEQHVIDKGRIDIYFTAEKNGNKYDYASECKDRWYTHTQFDEWFIEVDKYNELMNSGKKPLYINTFKDDWLIIWDLQKCKTLKEEERWLDKSTVAKWRGKVKKKIYLLSTKEAVISQKLSSCS